jgi:hypothetical protein
MFKSFCFLVVVIVVALANGMRAEAQVSVSTVRLLFVLTDTTKLLPITVLQTDIMLRNGSRVAFSLAQDLGSTGRNTSPEHFYGHVDHHFDYRKGHHGPMSGRGVSRPGDARPAWP